ncbi:MULTISPECIES: hypothetical protein [unclassified Flavobacterium]|jgi:hypothetical protein|uniref:hypothetical protein n=1 Tax=unclassified Flavobacterium TaxID=196869 RepID=UPI0025B972FA|nr:MULTISPECIES: hypothetical protein [unclassified Flavobacterium]
MKIKFPCSKCFIERIETIDFIQVQDESLYFYTCSQGHKNVYFEKNEKFELLMESAVYAILDGYYREAVSSMSASLERLQEFAIKVLYKESEVSDELFKTTWKEVSQQSERQLGAFIFLYTQKYKSIPDNLNSNERSFRNDIIHKGKFPTYEETTKYGQRILDITFNILNMLRSTSEQTIRNFANEKQEEMFRKFEEIKENPFTVLLPNIINLHYHISSFEKSNLVEYLELVKVKHNKKSTNT